MVSSALGVFVTLFVGLITCSGSPSLIGQFEVATPSFTALYPYSASDGSDLLISCFGANPFEGDRVYRVAHVETFLGANSSSITPDLLSDKLVWPNQISGVPESVFNKRLVAVPDGFLVPFKTKGSISLIDPSTAYPDNTVVLTERGDNWFYHLVEWRDMDKDGDLDILTCRADKPIIFGSTKAELLWLENEGTLQQPTPWKTHVIAQGPDIFFDEVKLTVTPTAGSQLSAIFVGQFFSPALGVFWVDNDGDWSQTDKISHRDIDLDIGPVFDVKVCDVNMDGRNDLLVTTNSGRLHTVRRAGRYYGKTGLYKHHLLAADFNSRTTGEGKGAPGAAQLVHLTNQTNTTKPSIILSGDDGGEAFILTPMSEAKDDWGYTVTSFLDVGSGTVGAITVGDVDRDGHLEMFVPAYNQNKVYVYRL